jgi:hypothetical protein
MSKIENDEENKPLSRSVSLVGRGFSEALAEPVRIPPIRCWLCEGPVESIERVFSPLRKAETWTVRCHGDEETFEVDDVFWMFFGSDATFDFLDAFAPKVPTVLPPFEFGETVDLAEFVDRKLAANAAGQGPEGPAEPRRSASIAISPRRRGSVSLD